MDKDKDQDTSKTFIEFDPDQFDMNDLMAVVTDQLGVKATVVTVVDYDEIVKRNEFLTNTVVGHLKTCRDKGPEHIYDSIIMDFHENSGNKDTNPDLLVCGLAAAFIKIAQSVEEIEKLKRQLAQYRGRFISGKEPGEIDNG